VTGSAKILTSGYHPDEKLDEKPGNRVIRGEFANDDRG